MLRSPVVVAFLLVCLASASFVLAGAPGKQNCPKSHKVSRTKHTISPSNGPDNAYVDNGVIRLGVYATGSLNAIVPELAGNSRTGPVIGVQYYGYQFGGELADATAPGCYCEGWGAAGYIGGSPVTEAYSTQEDGHTVQNAVVISPTELEATTTADIIDGPHKLTVQHHFRPSPATPKLYEVNVTITNTGSSEFDELHYVRTMDWDIAPFEYEECVDINLGTTGSDGDVVCAHFNGFALPQPSTVDGFPYLPLVGPCSGNSSFSYVEKVGPTDHGSAWHFKFRDITQTTPFKPNDKKSFLIYYGAADNDADANAVLAAAKIEAYSFGYARTEDSTCTRAGVRYIFGFGSVGGVSIVPSNCGTDCEVKNALPECGLASASASSDGKCASLSFDGSAACH